MSLAQLEPILALLRERARNLPATLEGMRADFETFASAMPVPEGLQCQAVDLNGLPGEWLAFPDTAGKTRLLYLHGGGYVIGSIDSHRALMARLTKVACARTCAINYRLAPEHPFPAALGDAVAAYRWLLSNGNDPKRVVLAGDSAGGGLVLAALVAIRDHGLPLPAAAVCISPWTDLACTGESMRAKASVDPLIQKAGALLYAQAYLGSHDAKTPLASPLYADMRHLPPVLIQVGGRETLLDDATRMAERLRAAGVDARIDIWDDMIHVWHFFAHQLDEGKRALDAAGAFIREKVRAAGR